MLHLSVRCVISLFFLEKQSEIRNAFTFFEKWKVKKIILSLFLRNEKWNDFLFHSFREVKVKLRYLEIEIEKWNFKKNLENSRETRLSLVTAMWQPSIQSTYGNISDSLDYISGLPDSMRLKHPNEMAAKELISSLTEVWMDQQPLFWNILLSGRILLQCLWEGHSSDQHLLWKAYSVR